MILCSLGWHRWTVIPLAIRERAHRVGLGEPDWYIGRQVPAYCARCGIKKNR